MQVTPIKIFRVFFISNLMANIQLYPCEDEIKAVKDAMMNGYMFAKSNCRNDYISSWNTQNIAHELESWFQSIKPSKNIIPSDTLINKNLVRLSKNVITDQVIVTAIGRIAKNDEDIMDTNFEGWVKYLYTSNSQFHDGFYYGTFKGVNGTITGKLPAIIYITAYI